MVVMFSWNAIVKAYNNNICYADRLCIGIISVVYLKYFFFVWLHSVGGDGG